MYSIATRQIFGSITHVVTQSPVAALTFDDGPHPEYTPRLLKVLKSHDAYATFFMLGKSVQQYPDLVKKIADQGHSIANHSWDHPSFPLLSGRERREQIRSCASAIAPFSGERLFRPPYCHQNTASRLDALWLRHKVVMWSVIAEDWCQHEATWMADRLAERINPGSIICLHDAIYRSVQPTPQYDRQPMIEAVDLTLERLKGHYQFITLPKLFQYGKLHRKNWRQIPDSTFLPQLTKHSAINSRLETGKTNAL